MKIIIIFLIIFGFNINVKAYNYNDEKDFYTLNFNNYNLSTNNLYEVSDKMQIIWIEPYNNIYLTKKRFYYINKSKFINEFCLDIQKKNYGNAINYRISGIPIKRIKVYGSLNQIKNIKLDNISIEN